MNWLIFGFACFGLVVGLISGVTSAEVTVSLLGFLFAFIGGSILAFFQKIKIEDREEIGKLLTAFSVAFIFSLCIGIYIKVNKGLTVVDIIGQTNSEKQKDYLRSNNVEYFNHIDNEYRNDRLSLEQAYDSLINHANSKR